MKRLIDRLWAKVTAFILLLVFMIMGFAGAAGVVFLTVNDAYTDGGKNLLYGRLCHDAINSVVTYLESSLKSFPPSDKYKAAFAENFHNSDCSILVFAGGTELLNYPYISKTPLCQDRYAYLYKGEQITITASLDPDRYNPPFAQQAIHLLIQGRYFLIVLTVLFIAAWIFFLVFTLMSAGHWKGHEGIHLIWMDRIPADLWILALVLWGVFLEQSIKRMNFFAPAVEILLFFLFLPPFAAQCKARTVFRNSAAVWILRVLRRVPLAWKTALGVCALLLSDVLCLTCLPDEVCITVLLLIHLAAGLFLVYLAIGLRTLQKGGQALAAGDYETSVKTDNLYGDFRRHGENLNAIQEGLQKALELKTRAERMRTELITNISHDIKTPVTSIVNYVDLLKKEGADSDNKEEYLEALERQSGRLRKLTEDLIDATRASEGNIPVHLSDTDVNVFLSQVIGEYREQLQEARVEPFLTLDESEPHIFADGKLLWRVLDNLLSNVCKYALPGTRFYLSSEVEKGKVCIVLKNISRDMLNISADELTERFVRGDISRSTEGSGLGLNIAMSLTRLQKGELKLLLDGDLFKVQLSFDQLIAASAEM